MSDCSERKNDARRDALGELFFGIPVVQEWVQQAREDLAAGVSEAEIRERILAAADDEGITPARTLFPGMNRVVRRVTLETFVRALVDHWSGDRQFHKVGDALDALSDALGFNDWLVDGVLRMARTGEASPMLDLISGKVWTQRIPGDEQEMVWAAAGPYCDYRELAEEFRTKCEEAFPKELDSRHQVRLSAFGLANRPHRARCGRSGSRTGRGEASRPGRPSRPCP